jgi:hypothetical protein
MLLTSLPIYLLGEFYFFIFFALNPRQSVPEDLKTTVDGICFDLKFMALHPFGNFSSQVTK